MKVWCVLLLISVCGSRCEVSAASWPSGILQSVTNRTDKLFNNVYNTGRSVSRHIQSYYDGVKTANRNMLDYVGDKQEKLTETFEGYIETALTTSHRLIDIIKPKPYSKSSKHNCTDQLPDVYMTTPQLIAQHGYPAESHTVLTDDGYLLTLHRIPHSRYFPRRTSLKTVFLHHGLLGSSADWVLAGPQNSLAYMLSDAGYDVWMANVRGNVYSRAHVSRKSDSYAFWNFTWHDVAQHDLPAAIDYIHESKGPRVKINYVGHSMGTTVLFVLLSMRPEYNEKLRAGFALAPVVYMSNIRSPIRLFAPFSTDIERLLKMLGANEFLPQNWVMRWLSEHACEINRYEEAICENSMFVLCGHDQKQFNKTLLPIILGHVPAGASTKSLVHYAQEIKTGGNFQQFDYGTEGNLRQYGMETPPQYNIRRVTLPIALLSAQNDWLAGEKDVSRLYADLKNKIEHYVVPLEEFNHIDFLWAIDAPKLVYMKLLKLLQMNVISSEK